MSSKQSREVERVLSCLGSEKISEVLTFKVQPSLATFIRKQGLGKFVRACILERLRRDLGDE